MLTIEKLENGDEFILKSSLKTAKSRNDSVECFRKCKVADSADTHFVRLSDGMIFTDLDAKEGVIKIRRSKP